MNRIEKFLSALEKERLDGFLVTSMPDIRYLSGFTGSAGMMWISPKQKIIMTDFRYDTQIREEVKIDAEIHITSTDRNYFAILKELSAMKGVKYAGFDSAEVDFNLYKKIVSEFPELNWIPTSNIIANIAAQKDEDEIEKIRRAAEVAIESLIETLPLLRPGIAEREFSAELEYRMRRKGSEKCPFDVIIASGYRAALPHGAASEKIIQKGEMIVIDFGATMDGYVSDITRTFFLGEPSEKFKKIYDTVLLAQTTAINSLRPGITGKELDSLARKVIEDAGFGQNFGHGLGHGLGLLVHGEPRVNQRNENPLPEHAVVTIEPGIYIAGWGGVRIEDDVLISPDGAVVLTSNLQKSFSDIIIPVE